MFLTWSLQMFTLHYPHLLLTSPSLSLLAVRGGDLTPGLTKSLIMRLFLILCGDSRVCKRPVNTFTGGSELVMLKVS